MGRSSKKQLIEIEKLQVENKELRTINKSLSRKLKQESKKYKPDENSDDLIQEEMDSREIKCEQCGKGKIIRTEIGPRVILACNLSCGNRKIIKK